MMIILMIQRTRLFMPLLTSYFLILSLDVIAFVGTTNYSMT